jgi:predicted RNA-binding protein with PUA-like domain
LENLLLLRHSRLSVIPVSAADYRAILAMAKS